MVEKDRNKQNPYDLKNCKLIGKGHNGEVYLLPNGNVIKMFLVTKDFDGECTVLEKVNGNRYFPKIYEIGSNYMVRDYIEGEPLSKYIKKNGMNRKIALDLINMLKEFKKLKFKKIDLRCKDILVQPDSSLKAIDSKDCYTKYRSFPRHLSKGLYNLGKLEYFLHVLKEEEKDLYKRWAPQISIYVRDKYRRMI